MAKREGGLDTAELGVGGRGSSAMGSALRCLKVMEYLAEEPFEYGVSEIAAMLSVPRPSAHRVLATLVQAGLVEQDRESRSYRLAPKALWVGAGYLRHSAVYRAAFFPMRDLSRQVEGTIQLGVEDRECVLFIHSVGHPPSAQVYADVGLRRPLHATATGKVIMSQWSNEEVKRLMRSQPEKWTSKTILSFEKMRDELNFVRRNGYAVNREELLAGVAVLAAPVLNRDGRIEGGISITMPASQLTAKVEARYVELLKESSMRASRQLGNRPGMHLLKR
jgi:DNA-binding IclR family transcriptional regulator